MKLMTTTFTLGEAIKFGWEKMKKHFWFFVGLLIITCLIQVVPTGIANIFKHKVFILYVFLIIGAWIIQTIVKMGVIKITLDVVDKDEASLNNLFSRVELLGKFILGSILYGFIVFAGLILLIVPGIIWAIKYQFFSFLIVDKKLSPLEAIKKSGEITSGNKSKLFWLGIMFLLINIAGAICLLIGLFATIPTTMVAMAYVYRKLMGEFSASEPIEISENVATGQPAS
jgi:uncharacterized membrane protein